MAETWNSISSSQGRTVRPANANALSSAAGRTIQPNWWETEEVRMTDRAAGIQRDTLGNPFQIGGKLIGTPDPALTFATPAVAKARKDAQPGGFHNYAGTTVNGQKPVGAFDSNQAFNANASYPTTPVQAPNRIGLPLSAGAATPANPMEQYRLDAAKGMTEAIGRIKDRQNPWADPQAMAQQNHAAQSDWFTRQTDNMREAQARAFGGPMVTGQDMANLNATGWAGLYGTLSNLEQQRKTNAASWLQQQDRDLLGAYGQQLGLAQGGYLLPEQERALRTAGDLGQAMLPKELEGADIGLAMKRLDRDTQQALLESVIAEGKAKGQITQAEARAAQQLAQQGGEWWNQGWFKNIMRGLLVGGGAVAGGLLGAGAGGVGLLPGVMYGASAGGAAAGAFR